MKRLQFIFTFCLLAVLQSAVFGQNPDNTIRIKIDANVDGKTVKIDTNISSLEDLDIDAYLRELGIDDELNQLNIDINSGFSFHWDEAAFDEMMEGLQSIEIPEIPELRLEGLDDLAFISPNKAVLGVYTEKTPEGAEITGLVKDGAAAEAGLAEGDIITGIDNRTIESPSNLSEVMALYEAGNTVKVTYLHNGKSETKNIVLKENKPAIDTWIEEWDNEFDSIQFNWEGLNNGKVYEIMVPERGYLGVYLDDADNGVEVTGIEENSPAQKAGLQEGDVITSLNNIEVEDYDELMDVMNNTKPGEKVEIEFIRNGKKEKTSAILDEVKGGNFYFNFPDEGNEPNIIIDHVAPLPPNCSYSYNSVDGNRNVTICITAVKDNEAVSPESNNAKNTHPLMDPKNLVVYSNPSDGAFNIKFNLNEEGDTKIVITDINGKEVFTETLKNFSGAYDKTISLSDAPKGTYFVKVTQNGYSGTKTVVLQ